MHLSATNARYLAAKADRGHTLALPFGLGDIDTGAAARELPGH